MSTLDTIHWVKARDALTLALYFTAVYIVYGIGRAFYSAYASPLRKFPGPRIRSLTNIPELWTMATGSEGTDYPELHQKYGPIVRISPERLSFAGGAQAWKDIHGFKKAGEEHVFKDRSFYRKPFNGFDSLVTADDQTHSRQRRIISHAFADKTLRDLEPMLKSWVEKMKSKLSEKAAPGEKADMLKFYNCTTFDIMGDLSFNEGLDMLDNGEYSSWVKSIFLGIKHGARLRAFKMLSFVTTWIVDTFIINREMFRKKSYEHWNYSKERVQRRLARTPERADLWSKILEKSQGPEGLVQEEHYSLASLFMIAGTETTASALSGVTYYLLKNPEYMQKLQQEIRETHSGFEDISLDSLARLRYMHAVLQEGLRMYPPIPTALPRKVPKGGVILDGEYVPGDAIVGIHQLSTYRNPQLFKNPYEFRPERWLGDPEYKHDHLDAMEPFSIGPRNCLGKNLAWHEMRLILATTLLHFDLELCEESQDWSDQKIYSLWEKRPLVCRLTTVVP